ncbi:MAG: hypothetical protein JO309_01425 [Pseudonocardiales bacterium]|nr:hypothetical protein [Pseudonocardiales bacterium]
MAEFRIGGDPAGELGKYPQCRQAREGDAQVDTAIRLYRPGLCSGDGGNGRIAIDDCSQEGAGTSRFAHTQAEIPGNRHGVAPPDEPLHVR